MAEGYLNALKKQLSEGWITPDEYQEAVAKYKFGAGADIAQKETDKILAGIEKRTHEAYQQATREMEKKVEKRLAAYENQKQKMQELVDKGKLDPEEFRNWKWRQLRENQSLRDMADVLAQDMHKTNLLAAQIANGGMADVYALNANYAMYDILKQGGLSQISYNFYADQLGTAPSLGTSFTLYNHDTAELLLQEEWALSAEKGKSSLLPEPSKKKKKELKQLAKTNQDELWNSQKFQSAILQGVLQGESPAALASRLSGVGKMNERQAIRNARTMTTNVQNMGRNRSYLNAKDMGIKLVIEWMATLDGATRHSHRQLHGEQKPNNKTAKFSNGCRWPGDPQGPAAEVYNCRCTTVSWVKGHESATVKESEWMKQNGQSFEEWQTGMKKTPKASEPVQQPAPTPATPKNSKPAKDPYEKAIKNAEIYDDRQHEDDNFSWDFWDSLTDDERNAIEEYTGSAYIDMNKILRGQSLSRSSEQRRDRYEGLINDCTDALSHRGLKNDTKLYRGMGSSSTLGRALGMGEGVTPDQIHDLVTSGNINGLSFVEKGFCSTGINPGAGWDKEVVMEIVAPKGTKGFYVDPVSTCAGEQECLLQRGAIFRIRNAEYLRDGTLKLHVVVTGNEPLRPL